VDTSIDLLGILFAVLPNSLAAASSLDLLSSAEQSLCANLQILPKPYLVIKDTLLRENARRGGSLLRKDAR
jgi:transcriptional adapter 2-alpha